MRVTAYGNLAPDEAGLADLETKADEWATEPGTHLLEGPSLQNVTWRDLDGRNSELPGLRLVLDQLATDERPESSRYC